MNAGWGARDGWGTPPAQRLLRRWDTAALLLGLARDAAWGPTLTGVGSLTPSLARGGGGAEALLGPPAGHGASWGARACRCATALLVAQLLCLLLSPGSLTRGRRTLLVLAQRVLRVLVLAAAAAELSTPALAAAKAPAGGGAWALRACPMAIVAVAPLLDCLILFLPAPSSVPLQLASVAVLLRHAGTAAGALDLPAARPCTQALQTAVCRVALWALGLHAGPATHAAPGGRVCQAVTPAWLVSFWVLFCGLLAPLYVAHWPGWEHWAMCRCRNEEGALQRAGERRQQEESHHQQQQQQHDKSQQQQQQQQERVDEQLVGQGSGAAAVDQGGAQAQAQRAAVAAAGPGVAGRDVRGAPAAAGLLAFARVGSFVRALLLHALALCALAVLLAAAMLVTVL